MKRFQLFILLALAAISIPALGQNQDWKKTQKFYWFGESADQKTGGLPAVAVGYGGPTGPRRNLIVTASHPVLNSYISNPVVTVGTIDGLDSSSNWLPPSSPCGSVRDVCFLIESYTSQDDFFKGTLCRDVPANHVARPATSRWPGDIVHWWSIARKAWVQSEVVAFDLLGRLSCKGTLAISQDSGSPVFTPEGDYVGAVSEYVDEIAGQKINGCLVVTFENPRIPGTAIPLPPNFKPGDDLGLPKQGPVTTVTIPRKPINLIPVGDYVFTVADPDKTIWRLKPPEDVWTQVSELPPIVKNNP